MLSNNIEIKQLLCAQLDVPNPSVIYILDRVKELPSQERVVQFIKNEIPEFGRRQECEDRALQVIALANHYNWAHGSITVSRTEQMDEHTMCVFIDDKKIVWVYDPSTKKYAKYPFKVDFIVMF